MKYSIKIRLISALLVLLSLVGMANAFALGAKIHLVAADYPVEEGGSYSGMEEIAVYLHTFGCLPPNFITKKEAQAMGWSSRAGNLSEVAPGYSIGGDHFGNYENKLPAANGKARRWTECDVDADGGFRNGKRVIFSHDGLIFYTENHYNSFRQVIVKESAKPAKR